jgi:DNA-binding PadR family transcriptional regulator
VAKSTDRTRARLSPSAYAVLGLLARQPAAGYELGARAASSIAHFWPLTRTHIYTELERLEALGYATSTRVAQQRLPDKRVYATTAAGRNALDAWLNDPDPGAYRPRHPMLIKLYFAARVRPERVTALLACYRAEAAARRERFAAILAEHDAAMTGPDELAVERRFQRATALFGLRRAEADLAWLDELPAALQLPAAGRA